MTGMLMGDATLNYKHRGNPCVESEMISPNFLQHLDKQMGVFGNGVKFKMSAEESANRARKSGFSPNAKANDYSDIYYWNSMTHPDLKEFVSWYESDKKCWPNNINLTPTVLKYWYCCDGFGNNNCAGKRKISISISNESDNLEKIDKMFTNVGLPSPNKYNIRDSMDGYDSVKCDATFNREESEEIFEYMGEPLPDFEYKW